MEKEKKILGIKNFTFVVVISSIMLALCTILAFGSVFYGANNEEGDWQLTGKKTTTWIDPGDYTKGRVEIEAEALSKEKKDQNVLFIGTLCGYHGLSLHTIEQSLNATAEYSNVDYFFFNNNSSKRTQKEFSGTLKAEEKFKIPDSYKDAYDKETPKGEGQWSSGLETQNHQALGKFFKCIYDQKQNKNYDFIVLEFDGTRITDWYRNLMCDWEKISRDGDYQKYENEKAAVKILKDYYDNNQVIWITDEEVTGSSEGYHPNRSMDVGYKGNTRTINYNSLKGLLCPDEYEYDVDEWEKVSVDYAEEQLNNITGFNDPVPDKYVLSDKRQVGYKNSKKVAQFLKEAISDLYTYKLDFDDVIDVGDNISFSLSDVSLWEYKNIESKINEYEWVNVTDDENVKITIDPENLGHVSCNISNLTDNHKYKLVINFKDKSDKERFIDSSVDGNPNDGSADISVTPNAGSGPTPVEPAISKDDALNWPIVINYKVEDKYAGKGPSVSNAKDEGVMSIPTVGKTPKGSNAINSPDGKYVFSHWTLEGKDTPTYPTANFVPDTTTDGINNGRYHEVTYVAHYKEMCIVRYEVQGAEIPGIADYVTPSDSITPENDFVAKGTKNYPLDAIPTTKWITSDGTEKGIPGVWTFLGDSWYIDQKYEQKISSIDEIVNDEYVVYGKWMFTQKPMIMSFEKTATLDSGAETAKPGDTISYKIEIKNGSAAITNMKITDAVDELLAVSDVSDDGVIDKDNVITWTLATLDANASITVTFKAKIPESIDKETAIKNTSIAIGEEIDETKSNTVETIVVPESAPSIAKVEKIGGLESEAEVAKPGDVINYVIKVTNGDVDVLNLTIQDAVDKSLFVSDISDNGKIDKDNIITWEFDSIDASDSKIVSFKATIPTTIAKEMVIQNIGKASGTDTLEKDSSVVEIKVSPNTPGPTPDPGSDPTPGGNVVKTGDIVSGTALLILAGLFVAGMFIIRLRSVNTKERG